MLRDATAADAPAIAAYWNPLIRTTTITFSSEEKSLSDLAAMIAERPWFLVAEVDGRVAGHATCAQFRGGNGYVHAHEHTIIVDPAAQAHGVGRALMTALEGRARDGGVHVMVAGISGENQAALRFHAALGYAETGRMPQVGRKFGRWLDLVLMQKCL
ncbi:N-acetyltransferase family protein [Paracoccus sp. p4-l81]|uniref:GNAT family N-acetyltransferase n=1 Tax=unclassified Paracoccus (in: a-proteobacteria) TaxID=2688777 RepID=UPI0035BB830C